MPDRRTIHCTALLLAASLWAGSAAAQVTRCSDPVTGKITYTDGDCAAGQARKEVAPRQSPEDIQRERDQAQRQQRPHGRDDGHDERRGRHAGERRDER